MILLGTTLYPAIGRAPRNWENAVGYVGEARFVGLYWEPCGDEAIFTDGVVSSDGDWSIYLEVVDALALDEETRYSLGSSEEEATHYLVLDRSTRELHLLPRVQAERFLTEQHPPARPLSMEETQALYEQAVAIFQAAAQRAQEELRHGVIVPCPACGAAGWLHTEDGGYERCSRCEGKKILIEPKGR